MVISKTKADIVWAKIKYINLACFIGKDTIAFGYGSILQFTDILTGSDCYYRADCEKNGDGLNCLCGHKNLMIFAFGEMVARPRIFVIQYPSLKHVAILHNPSTSKYNSLVFSHTELIIALTGMPDFLIQIFSWRSGTNLVSIPTDLQSATQIARFNMSGSSIGQLAIQSPKLFVWEVHGTLNKCKLLKRRVKLPETSETGPFAFTFYTDGTIMFMNSYADVYNIHPITQHSIKIIENPERIKGNHPFVHLFRNGIILTVGDWALKYYKKINNVWSVVASLDLHDELLMLKTYLSDSLIGITLTGEIVQYVLDKGKFDYRLIRKYSRKVKNFIYLNPLREYIVTITIYDVISIFNKLTGKRLASVTVPDSTLLREHPIYPYLAVGDKHGSIHLISGYQAKNLKLITSFHLCHNHIVNINFTKKGLYFAVNDIKGDFFVLSALIGCKMEILVHIPMQERILDFTITETDDNIILYALRETPEYNVIACGDVLVRIMIDKSTNYKIDTMYLDEYYIQINMLLDANNKLLAIPLCSTQIRVMEISPNFKTNKQEVKIIDTYKTFHKLKYFQMRNEGSHVMTYGMDGIITIIDLESKKDVLFVAAHHRLTLGIVVAKIDVFMEYIISLGNSGNIVCFKILAAAPDAALLRANRMLLKSVAIINMFKKETIGFEPSGADTGKSWIDMHNEKILEHDRKKFAELRETILNDFDNLKSQIEILITQNDYAPENEKLPIQAFNLDKDCVDSIKEIARKDREQEDKTMKNYCKVQSEIVAWLMKNCWEKMEVQGSKLRGMFVKLCAENYALLKRDAEWEQKLKSVALWRSTEAIVSANDKFQPWMPLEIRELEEILSREPKIDEQGELDQRDSFYSNENEFGNEDAEEVKRKKLEELKYSLTGTNTHKYIDPLMWRYSQMEVVTYSQMNMENIMGYHDMLGLREYFNKQFEKLQTNKELEMHGTRQRNERLRYIQNELNILAKLKNSEVFLDEMIVDPEYTCDEKPNSIVVVEEWEVPITPYISPSRQKLLDEMAAEAERRRLEMLADDFRERALMTMMDGVLEIRWEDEIKKNPPIPEVMLSEKDPKDYDEADLKIIYQYEQKLKFLNSERERYRLMLEQEQIKLSYTLDDQIMKFNYKVGELSLNKMKIEFAINCEKMKLLKNYYYNYQRIKNNKMELELKHEIQIIEKDSEVLSIDLNDFEESFTESLNTFETAVAKDKQLDKQFKLSFSEHASPAVTDLAYKFFKRRAKWQMRTWATPSILFNMASRVIANKELEDEKPMPQECIEYLELLERNDNYALAPNTMDQNTWEILCKMRRIKIESEFKVRSYGAQHAEIEAATNCYVKEINVKKQQIQNLQRQLDDLRNTNLENSLNRYIQIVMKRGLVEIPISGRISDFDDAVMIHMTDVDDINKIIKKAGKKKIIAMQNAAVFRRKIIFKEWEHLVLIMTVRDMEYVISVIDKFQITKEVQVWLKRKKKGWHDDFSQTALNRDIAAMVTLYEKILDEIISKTNDMEKKIDTKKTENNILDKKIQSVNIDITELNFGRDLTMEERELRGRHERMTILVERSKLVRLVQQQHAQILELSTILELQKLRTYPTLNINCDGDRY